MAAENSDTSPVDMTSDPMENHLVLGSVEEEEADMVLSYADKNSTQKKNMGTRAQGFFH